MRSDLSWACNGKRRYRNRRQRERKSEQARERDVHGNLERGSFLLTSRRETDLLTIDNWPGSSKQFDANTGGLYICHLHCLAAESTRQSHRATSCPAAPNPSRPLPAENPPGMARLDRPLSLSAQVERLLRQAIAEGRFADGKLPTEVELAEQLGVSRETVRLAAEVLRWRRTAGENSPQGNLHANVRRTCNFADRSRRSSRSWSELPRFTRAPKKPSLPRSTRSCYT